MMAAVSSVWLENLATDAFAGEKEEAKHGFHFGSTDDMVKGIDFAFSQEDLQQEVEIAKWERQLKSASK